MSSEPPSHPTCAYYAATTCPFLTQPRMRRNDRDMPEESEAAVGHMLLHNPGVCCIWTTREYRIVPVDTGILFRVGDPQEVRWLCRGKPALRYEVIQAMDRGVVFLVDEAKQDGEDALKALLQAIHRMRQYLPDGERDDGAGATADRTRAMREAG